MNHSKFRLYQLIIYLPLLFTILGSLTHILSCNDKLQVKFIHETMAKIDKMAIFVNGTLSTLQSNNWNYKKQMFLYNDKLLSLLLGCVINVNRNNCIN